MVSKAYCTCTALRTATSAPTSFTYGWFPSLFTIRCQNCPGRASSTFFDRREDVGECGERVYVSVDDYIVGRCGSLVRDDEVEKMRVLVVGRGCAMLPCRY